jgi:hypothetical protein
MAQYQDVQVAPPATPDSIYTQITNLLIGAYSVEVLPDGTSVILRVWFSRHCDPAGHVKIP